MAAVSTVGELAQSVVVPEPGQLVRVRGRHWVVADVSVSNFPSPRGNGPDRERLVTLTSVEDDRYDESIQVLWSLERGAQILEQATMPAFDSERLDDPGRLAAFLDAVRWGAVTSADSSALQAPFRSGIAIEDYQLDPVVRAIQMPRVNLLVADDVGLGKTIEAGLVVQELLLRHRARSVLVICPASLCVKWRDEMAEKFGLEFRIVDTELLRQLRRTRGLRANPWTHFPRLVTSIDWLKRERPLRLLRDTLPAVPTYPRAFDLLIVDEVHNVVPSGRGRYVTDSARTRAIRAIAPHFEHRLFLSATPHNGYRESFTTLLELLDAQRFARLVEPDPTQLNRVMVRRLKSELPPRPDGTPRFPRRVVEAIRVAYPAEERQSHLLLERYSELRRRRARDDAGKTAVEFSLKLLKKRLFSSPAAFARTLAVHRQSAFGGVSKERPPGLRVLTAAIEATEDDVADEEEQAEALRTALATSALYTPLLEPVELELLDDLERWATGAAERPDAKAAALLSLLDDIVRPVGPDGRQFSDDRVILFTEYRDTQRYLIDVVEAHGLGGDRLAVLHGGMDQATREHTKDVFQADPSLDPARILVATDAASEGIDLQAHCHRLVHYEIPWNPNRLEQRNGRIDRHGQRASEVLVWHFAGARAGRAEPGSLDGDLEFLHLVAEKVDAIREDLGSVGPVLAAQIEARMLGQRRRLDENEIERAVPNGRVVRLERDLRDQINRLHERLGESVAALHLTPANVERVVRTALALAHQPDLIAESLEVREDGRPAGQDGWREEPVFRLGRLTGSWARASEGLAHPVTGEVRPLTFDHEVASGRDEVVLAHLGHRLVAQAVWLLRAEVWAGTGPGSLARVTARVIPDGIVNEIAVIAHGRLVLTGAEGHRLHEEVITAGGLVRQGRFARLSSVREVQAVIGAPTIGRVPQTVCRSLEASWTVVAEALLTSLVRRQQERVESLAAVLARRAEEDQRAIEAVLSELERSIRAELNKASAELQLQLPLFAREERTQAEGDLEALRRRLSEIPAEVEAEAAHLRRRYADPKPRLFPAAVEVCVPEGLVARP